MRIKRFELKAFGPFTGKILEFAGATPGLHVIFGPNEAGKSCTLRALIAWLYGIDERTRDNFLHPNDQLLLAGLLENSPGEELYIARRKKRKADLLDATGNPLDPGLLAAMLHGINQNTFKQLFGLDHDTLVEGGTTILQEKGSAGTILFSAGTGIASLQQVLTDLRAESDEIFKGRASRPPLNAALRDFADLKREIHKASLSSREYKNHDKALRYAQGELEQAQKKRTEYSREENRLERIRQAIKPLGLRRDLMEKLAKMGEVRPLPEDFSQRRAENQSLLRSARQTLTAASGRLQEFQKKAGEIHLNTELLDQADTIEDLHQRIGAYRKGMSDLSSLKGKQVQEKTLAGNILRRIRPDLALDKAEELSPLLRRRRGINEVGGKLPLLEQHENTTTRELRKVEKARSKAKTSLQNLPTCRNLQPLAEAIANAIHLGDIDATLQNRSQELSHTQTLYASGLKQIGLWCGSPRDLLEERFPLAETINRFAEDLRKLAGEQESLQQRREELDKNKKRLLRDIGTIEKAGEVPTEKELSQFRALRDRGWKLLRRQWLEGEDVSVESRDYNPELPLPEAYEQQVGQVDNTADRLRREAERVHKYAHLVADLEGADKEMTELSELEAALPGRVSIQVQRWQETWQPCGVSPLPPAEMATWISKIEQLRFQARQIVSEEEKIENLAERRRAARKRLREALADLQIRTPEGEDLAPLLQKAQDFHAQASEMENKRNTLQESLVELDDEISLVKTEFDQAREGVEDWQRQWGEILQELGLSERETPGGVEDFFKDLEDCLNHLEKAEDFRKRIIGIERDADHLKDKVQGLLRRVAPDLMPFDIDQAIERLSGLLSRARKDAVTMETCRDEIEKAENEIRQATFQVEIAEAELTELCKIAGCDRQEDLEEAERRWQERLRLEERVEEEEERLRRLALGQSLEDFEDQADQVDPDEIPGQLQGISEELEKVNQQISDLSERIGIERTELSRMDGRSEAARMAEEAEGKLAEVRRLAERYARLRISAKVLEDEIEHYREENQDPVLKLAAGYFSELTLGSFEGLRTDIDDRGEQVIVGLRNGGDRVAVAGMSSGTRDQLFLALRLASLEHRLEKNEAVPFIVDDILVNFDEARAQATLKALAGLARKNQIILFTHHWEIAESAKGLGGDLILLN